MIKNTSFVFRKSWISLWTLIDGILRKSVHLQTLSSSGHRQSQLPFCLMSWKGSDHWMTWELATSCRGSLPPPLSLEPAEFFPPSSQWGPCPRMKPWERVLLWPSGLTVTEPVKASAWALKILVSREEITPGRFPTLQSSTFKGVMGMVESPWHRV